MEIYESQVSKRLDDFFVKYLTFEDNGDVESGPSLDSSYTGPEWAYDLYYCATDWTNYQNMIAYSNYFPEDN
jgi:hypothetical protein